jgi:hypothetical protein
MSTLPTIKLSKYTKYTHISIIIFYNSQKIPYIKKK